MQRHEIAYCVSRRQAKLEEAAASFIEATALIFTSRTFAAQAGVGSPTAKYTNISASELSKQLSTRLIQIDGFG